MHQLAQYNNYSTHASNGNAIYRFPNNYPTNYQFLLTAIESNNKLIKYTRTKSNRVGELFGNQLVGDFSPKVILTIDETEMKEPTSSDAASVEDTGSYNVEITARETEATITDGVINIRPRITVTHIESNGEGISVGVDYIPTASFAINMFPTENGFTMPSTVDYELTYTGGTIGIPDGETNVEFPVTVKFTVPDNIDEFAVDTTVVQIPVVYSVKFKILIG